MVHSRRVIVDLPQRSPIDVKITKIDNVVTFKKIVGRQVDGDEEREVFADPTEEEMMFIFSKIIEFI